VPELIEPVTAPADTAAADGAGPAEDLDEDDESGDRPRRRRRGRRGRGPRRPEDELAEDEAGEDPVPAAAAEVTDEPDEADADGEEDDDQPSGTRRRRRRRRSGSAGAGEELAEDVPTVVREPREPREPRTRSRSGATSADEDGVRGITGSTRMAAKRVRRQEGRDSGRGRKPVLSEAEFLARREAVDRTMVVRQKGDRTQIAVLEDGILVEHYVTRASAQSYAGNVYLGRVQNVLPSMEAAFVDIGKSRNAVLYAGEVNYNASAGGRSRSIESVLKSGQEVLVQVSKDPIGSKGSRLTGQVSLPGRYLVYVPEGTMTGISRKLPETERERLKKVLKQVVPEGAGVIIRTAAEGASEEEIAADVRRLQAQWEVIQTKAAKGGAPALLHAEPDLVIRVVRDVFNEDFTRLVVQGDSEWATIRDYVEFVAPELAPRLSRHTSEKDVFAEHRIDEQLLKALDRKVYLPSGGSLVIDRTEAMVVIDVNTGKFVGKGGNLEETVTRNNLEAAEEIARQLRLRDVGGIIVVDFIDMVLESNRDLVVRRLVECLGRDRTKHQVAEVTSLGLVQMTRKRVGQGLLESFSEPCESCNGRGVHVHPEPVDEGRGGSSEDDARRAPRRKPTPPDAPKPRSAVLAPALATPSALDGAAPVLDGTAPADEDPPAAPRRRRRGGRGTGAATLAPESELSELLSGTPGQPAVDAPADVVPELADQPPAAAEDLPVDLAPDDVAAAVLDAEGAGAPLDADSSSDGRVSDQPVHARPVVGSPPAAAPEAAVPELAAPKRRRRATSRPAGPPS
jgi:ribonuclease E